MVEIGHDVPRHPFDDRFTGLEGEVELLAIIRDQREAKEGAADAVIFGV
jgi:hypothetical protein